MNINITELTLENVGKWPKPIKWGVMVILSLTICGMGYQLIIKSNIDEYNTLVQKEESLRGEFERLQHLASNLQAYREQMKIMTERFGNMLKRLPTKNEMPSLLEDISKTGIASGLTFDLFAPEPEKLHDFYVELPIQISVIGNYHQVAIFLSRVAEMNRIVTLHDFVIEVPSLNQKKGANGDQLNMKIKATIYRYRTK